MTHSERLSTSCFKLLLNYLLPRFFFREGCTDLAEGLTKHGFVPCRQIFTLVITYR